MNLAQAKHRLDLLNLPIEIDADAKAEIATLTKFIKQHSQQAALDDADNDCDPDSIAIRQSQIARDLFREEQQRNERSAALANRYYAKRGKELNSITGLRN